MSKRLSRRSSILACERERTNPDGQCNATCLKENEIALQTWRWCEDFVVPLELCPWAAASVNTQGALRIYLSKRSDFEMAVEEAAKRLHRDVKAGIVDPNVAIAFVVSSDRDWGFSEFYEWFDELEKTFVFEDDYDVTLAPFHPDWQYGGGPPEFDMEKRSPYPTVTVVCTSVIDKAGPTATDQIGRHNEQVLLDLGISKLRQLYQTKVFQNKEPPSL